MEDVFEWLESSALAEYMRHSHTLYPAVETIHIAGFVVLVGSAFLFDLRLLGLSKKIPVTDLARHLLPWSRRSLFVVLPSGFVLFMTQATELANNGVFHIKLVLILIAFANAGYFHWFTFKTVPAWDTLRTAPGAARAAGAISVVLWAAVITCGRFLAYLE